MFKRLFRLNAFLLVLSLSFLGCDKENKDDYKTVSELIANRNSARYDNKSGTRKLNLKDQNSKNIQKSKLSETKEKTDELSTVIIYEERVEIISSSSNKTLAKAIAYINKEGKIIRIKIVN